MRVMYNQEQINNLNSSLQETIVDSLYSYIETVLQSEKIYYPKEFSLNKDNKSLFETDEQCDKISRDLWINTVKKIINGLESNSTIDREESLYLLFKHFDKLKIN